MIISVVIISYTAGGVLFSRFYGHELHTSAQQAEWLKKQRDATAPDWPLLKEDNPEQVAAIGEVQVMYRLIGDIVLMLSGVDEHDALLLLELSRNMVKVISKCCHITQVKKTGEIKVSAERKILQHYANLCMTVDEMIDDGDIDHLDPNVVTRLLKMRPTDTIQNIRNNQNKKKQQAGSSNYNQEV